VAVAVVSVLLLAAVVAALYLLWARQAQGRQLAQARAQATGLARRLAAVTAERDELDAEVASLGAANSRATADADRLRERGEELALLLEAATAEPPAPRPGASGGLWDLLLAHITRRWAAVVGVPPGNRHIVPGPAAEQLAQALAREVERLREEVGVDVELSVSTPVDPADGVPFLLAAVELLGALASSAERVSVDLDGRLVLSGDGWIDPDGEVGTARDRALAAGARVGPVDARAERVRVEVLA
jgi:hypothetical protein